MEHPPQDKLDDLIESALSSEPLREVPADFHQRLRGRLRIATLVQTERRQFRYRAASALVTAWRIHQVA